MPRERMSTILVGVDGSERSLDALAFARALAGASSAEVRVDTATVAGASPADGLQQLAEQRRAAIVIVGSSRVGAVGRVLPGSTGERLLRRAPCPVAVVPRDYRTGEHSIRWIGVAYDGSHEADAALRGAVEIARATRAGLRVIRAIDVLAYGAPALTGLRGYVRARADVERRAREQLDEAVRGLPDDIAIEAKLLAGDPAREIAAQTATLDLLVTGSRRYRPLGAVLLGAVTGRLLRNAECPVLVVPRGVDAPLAGLFAAEPAIDRPGR